MRCGKHSPGRHRTKPCSERGARRWTSGAKWDDLGLEDRRRVVQALAERIEVGPAVRGKNFYVPERVKVTYR
jgi:hypothetical protein